MAGALKTLFQMLQQSPYLTSAGVSLIFGAEEINTQRYQMPYVVMIPVGGTVFSPGYAQNTDPALEMQWETKEMVDLWCWASSPDPQFQAAIDHVDAIESLRQLVLSALQDQRAQYVDESTVSGGLSYVVQSGKWETVPTNAPSRFGRAYVITVQVSITIPMAPKPVATGQATITSITLNPITVTQ